MTKSRGGWTPEKIKMLRLLWGTKPTKEIAKILGVKSKNAVIGKAHRIGLASIKPVKDLPRYSTKITVPKVSPPKKDIDDVVTFTKKEEKPQRQYGPATLMNRGSGCCYPLWPNADRPSLATSLYCGAERWYNPRSELHSSYCEEHHRITHMEPKPRPIKVPLSVK